MRTYIKKIREQALAAEAAPVAEARNDTDRPLKPRNLDLYYGHLYMSATTSISNARTILRLWDH